MIVLQKSGSLFNHQNLPNNQSPLTHINGKIKKINTKYRHGDNCVLLL